MEIQDGKVSCSVEEIKLLASLLGKQKAERAAVKSCVNGQDVIAEATLKDGYVHFKAKGYKSGRKSGYPLIDLKTAKSLFEVGQVDKIHSVSKIEGVYVGGGIIFRNLVKSAEVAGLLTN